LNGHVAERQIPLQLQALSAEGGGRRRRTWTTRSASSPAILCAQEWGRPVLSAAQMQSLPEFFGTILDPRRAEGKRHRLPTVLAIAAAAVLCGMRGYKAIADWAQSLGQKARRRFGCRWEKRSLRGAQ